MIDANTATALNRLVRYIGRANIFVPFVPTRFLPDEKYVEHVVHRRRSSLAGLGAHGDMMRQTGRGVVSSSTQGLLRSGDRREEISAATAGGFSQCHSKWLGRESVLSRGTYGPDRRGMSGRPYVRQVAPTHRVPGRTMTSLGLFRAVPRLLHFLV